MQDVRVVTPEASFFPLPPFCLNKDRAALYECWETRALPPTSCKGQGSRESCREPPPRRAGKAGCGGASLEQTSRLRWWAEPAAGKAGNREEAFHALG